MRKTLLAVAIIAAGGLAYYQYSGQSAQLDMAQLANVPADTAIFSAQIAPVDVASYLTSLGIGPQYYSAESQQVLTDMLEQADSTSQKFIMALAQAYMKALSQPEQLTQNTGIKTQLRSLFYMVGLSPVLQLEIADEAAFWRLFDQVEQASGLSQLTAATTAPTRRVYRLAFEQTQIDFYVTVVDGWANLVLTSEKFDAEHRAIALGEQQPAVSLASSGLLNQIIEKYKLSHQAIGYISSAQLTQVITSTDSNRLAKDVNTLFGTELGLVLTDWRNTACQTDVAAISQSWPGIYLDNSFDLSDPTAIKVAGKVLIPTENQQTIAALKLLRGFIPAALQNTKPANDSIMQLAIGLDVAQLSTAANKLWDVAVNNSYSCAPLLQQQQQMKQSNPLAALAMTGMVGGLQGVSITVYKLAYDPVQQAPTELDALLSFSMTNANQMFDSLKAFYPPLASVKLPEPGQVLDVATFAPEVAMLGITPKLQASEHHLMIYSGEQGAAQAQQLAKEALAKNGLLGFSMDYQRFFTLLSDTIATSGEEVPADLMALKNTEAQVQVTVDVNDQGFLVNSVMQMSQVKSAQP